MDVGDSTRQLQLDDVVRAVGLALANHIVYGRQHRLTVESFDEGFARLSNYLSDHGQLLLGQAEGRLIANSRRIASRTRNMQTLAQALAERDISALDFQPGTTSHEFREALEMLSMPPVALDGHGGVQAFMAKNKIHNISLAEVTAEPLLEEEVIVRPAADGVPGSEYAPGNPENDAAVLLSYLQTGNPAGADNARRAVASLVSDAHLIAEIILDAATVRSGDSFDGCDFGVLVDCVRRAANVIAGSPAADTSPGQLMLIGTLDDLREEILFSVQTEDDQGDYAQRTLGQVIEEAKELLNMERLFSDYAQKRKILASRERRIVDYLRDKGFGLSKVELEQRLKEHGFSEELWNELWDKSFRRPARGRAGTSPGAVDRFESFAKTSHEDGGKTDDFMEQLINNMADVELEIISLVEQTRARIDSLGKTFAGALSSPVGPSRDQVLELARLLVTIGHGLSEPVKMLSTSVEILRSTHLGKLSEAQHAVLQMAAISGQRLQALSTQLMAIAEENQT